MALQVERVVPSPYMLHKKKPVSDVCEYGFVEYFYSKNDVRTGNLEFVIEGNTEHLIIPSKTYLKLQLELSGKAIRGGTTKTEHDINATSNGALVAPINSILQSIFESVDVYISNQAITKTDKHHAYNNYIQTVCNYGVEPLNTYFKLCGWVKDTASQMDDTSVDSNKGLKTRRAMFHGGTSPTGEYIGKLCSPLFFQEKVLPTQVSMKIVLKKADDSFTLMHENGNFALKIKEAVLMVQKVAVVPNLRESYIKLLEDDHSIPYFLRTPSINYYTIEQGTSQFMRDDLFLGKLPRRIIIGMVETEAYHGKRDKNPFNFQHFNLAEIGLYKDGMSYPRPLLRMDFENDIYAEAYHNFLTSLNAAYGRNAPTITMNDYKNGFTLFSYDMSPDQFGSMNPGSMLSSNSNIRLEMKFKTALPKNITLLVYNEMDHLMEINRDRRVTIDL
jgi:hypothetical protein